MKTDNLQWYQWQYNGIAPFREILIWCTDTLPKNSFGYRGWETIDFFDESAYVLFLMRWS